MISFIQSTNTLPALAGVNKMAHRQLSQHRDRFDPDNLKDFIDVYLDTVQHGGKNDIYTGKIYGSSELSFYLYFHILFYLTRIYKLLTHIIFKSVNLNI